MENIFLERKISKYLFTNYILDTMNKKKPLHPIQIQILKALYNQKMTIYYLSKTLKLPSPQVRYHVMHLVNKNLLKKEKRMDNAYSYYTNKELIQIVKEKDKDVVLIKVVI